MNQCGFSAVQQGLHNTERTTTLYNTDVCRHGRTAVRHRSQTGTSHDRKTHTVLHPIYECIFSEHKTHQRTACEL